MFVLYICIFFGILRLYRIGNTPVFWDESIYLGIAENFRKNPAELLHTFDYYPYPVMIWLQTIVGYLYPLGNPLIISRVFLAFSDLISAYFIFLIVRKISGIKASLVAPLFYLSLPLTFFHSRFVMLESLTNMFAIIALYRAVRHIYDVKTTINPVWIITQALLLTISFFTKPIVILYFPFIFLIPLYLLVAPRYKNIIQIKFVIFEFLLAFIISSGIIFLLASPYKSDYTYYLSDGGNFNLNTFIHFKANLWKAAWWSNAYLTNPLIWLVGIIFIWSLFKKNLLILLLFIWCLVIFVMDSFLIRFFFPRHLYPLAFPVSLIVALWFDKAIKRLLIPSFLIILILLVNLLAVDSRIILEGENAPIALEDKQQFYDDWTSGSGLDITAEKINLLSAKKDITIMTQNDPLITWALPNLYLSGNVKFVDVSTLINDELKFEKLAQEECDKALCFLILNINPQAPGYKFLKFEYSVQKGRNRNINIYSVSGDVKGNI